MLANFGGNIWIALVGLVFVPVYIRFMGIEAYGLLGIFTTLMALFGLLDMGVSGTVNREMARLAVQDGKAQEMRDLIRTLEIPYWLVGIVICIIIVAASRFIAYRWVNVETLAPSTVQTVIILMGFLAFLQWPMSFYSSGLEGLQRQVLLNGINVAMATFRALGALLVLWFISPTAEAFFLWQIVVSVIHTGLYVLFFWRSLPQADKPPRLRRDILPKIWRFAAGMYGTSVLFTILSQMDKLILSRILNLKLFGYYSLASYVAQNLFRLISPVFSATYPQLTNLVALDRKEAVKILYHKSAQLMSVLVLPAALIVALFSRDIMLLWTRNPITAENAYLLVSILVLGVAFNGLMNIPYALQLANGWTRLSLIVNLGSVLLLVPSMILLSMWFGGVGAASAFLIQNAAYLIISISIMHRRLLPTEKWHWYWYDIGRPLLAALVIVVIGRLIIKPYWSVVLLIVGLVLVSGGTLLAAASAADKLGVVTKIANIAIKLRLRFVAFAKPK
ncbi:MAG: oligosaccharide flippase family protein [Anaerolineae bacterium]